MSEGYKPPFTITEEITNLVIEIAEMTGMIALTDNLSKNPTLRRENRIHSIHSSLAIERNSLTIDQVSDVIDGKRVLGPPKDIREVQNAYDAYEMLTKLNPYSIKDLLTAHKIIMLDLVKESGIFRSGGVGVYAGKDLIHAGTPPQYVPDLISELFKWLKESTLHPLIKSCIFHYEFEFIHPFIDGNGRVGRMWHTLILAKWKKFFLWLPIETLIHEQQEEYYAVINAANTDGESTVFVKFMLEIIKMALEELIQNVNEDDKSNNSSVRDKLLELLKANNKISAKSAAAKLDLSERQIQRLLKIMKDEGKIERVGSNRNGSWIVLE
ncbi:Fic family protein [Kineothrix sp. MB12-C1]|uniref:Fic family protein n=1 Tax=Kineothrix sp. MB12-C1 TaxID=3070215 RepID=UPI0027D33E3A|nr:Fic family protein [Kineothrix sp. MB12-C1]WMC93364.1 Fic family protein [Kineothrix sp. MB12-C1]